MLCQCPGFHFWRSAHQFEAEETNDASAASLVASDEDLLQHVHTNAIADYYDIKALAAAK